MTTKKMEPGSLNMAEVKDAIKTIEITTNMYKRKRMSTEKYIKLMHENLIRLTSERNYFEYLKNIGQQ